MFVFKHWLWLTITLKSIAAAQWKWMRLINCIFNVRSPPPPVYTKSPLVYISCWSSRMHLFSVELVTLIPPALHPHLLRYEWVTTFRQAKYVFFLFFSMLFFLFVSVNLCSRLIFCFIGFRNISFFILPFHLPRQSVMNVAETIFWWAENMLFSKHLAKPDNENNMLEDRVIQIMFILIQVNLLPTA